MLTIQLDLSRIQARIAQAADTNAAIQSKLAAIGNCVHYNWAAALMGAGVPGAPTLKDSEKLKEAYERIQTEVSGNQVTIYSEDPAVIRLEKGHNGHDMKTTHPYGYKSRVNKKKEPYLIVPFAKAQDEKSKSPIPPAVQVYIEKQKKAGWAFSEHAEGFSYSPNFHGQMVKRFKYKWGQRIDLNPHPLRDKTRKYSGLYRFKDTGYAKERTRIYGIVSFRTIKAAPYQKGKWIIPAKEGKHLLRHILRSQSAEISRILGEA